MGFLNWEKIRVFCENHWAELDESQRLVRYWLAGAVLVVALAVPGWLLGRPAWQRWQQRQALAQVMQFARQTDYRNATLALRRAIDLAPNDPGTWQEAVRILGDIGSPEVLQAREQLTRLQPEDVGLKLALANEALRFDRVDLAEQTLAAVADEARHDEAFFRLATALAQAVGRFDEVEANLERLAAAAPADPGPKFGLAAVRLWGPDEAKRTAARASLEAMLAEPRVRVRAALELLKDATRQHDERRTTELMSLLLRRFVPELPADFPSTTRAAWERLLANLKAVAAEEGSAEAAALARWLADTGQPRETLLWLESLPATGSGAAPVRDMAAQLSAEAGDLDRLEKYLREGAWGQWPREALTLAIGARLQHLRYNDAHAHATWEDALTEAGGSVVGLRALVRLAEAWNDKEALEAALQTAAQRTGANWAYEALEFIYGGRRDLPKLLAVYEGWVKQRPADDRLAARWLTVASLLNRLGPEGAARAEALQIDAREPVGRALALAAVRWRQGRAKEAAALISGLPAEAHEQPATAFWIAVILADVGHRIGVRDALRVALRPGLSTEETTLLRAAAAKAKIELPTF